MGTKLVDADEGVHEVGTASNWNESRYVDFWDAGQRLGGWFRIGNRVNEGHAEMSACLYLPDGRVAFFYERPSITTNTLRAGSQSWEILEPWRSNRVRYSGDLLLLDDPWSLTDPKTAFRTAPRAHGEVDLICRSSGLSSVMGSDQDHIERIFLPGQADLHYQHLTRSTGSVRVGDHSWTFRDAGGGKDHSWGVRNWHAKIYLRWLIASLDDDHGFLLVRAVGPTKQTRSGFVLDGGRFHLVDDFEMRNEYAGCAPLRIASGAAADSQRAASLDGDRRAAGLAALASPAEECTRRGRAIAHRQVADQLEIPGATGSRHVRVPRPRCRRASGRSARLTVMTAPLGIEPVAVEAWFLDHVAGARPPLRFTLIAGGHSNLTYQVEDSSGQRFALRRPPLGDFPRGAHDVLREHRILHALRSNERASAACRGRLRRRAVTGAPFYVMAWVDGAIVDRPAGVAARVARRGVTASHGRESRRCDGRPASHRHRCRWPRRPRSARGSSLTPDRAHAARVGQDEDARAADHRLDPFTPARCAACAAPHRASCTRIFVRAT